MFRVYAFDEGNEMTAQDKSPFVLELKRNTTPRNALQCLRSRLRIVRLICTLIFLGAFFNVLLGLVHPSGQLVPKHSLMFFTGNPRCCQSEVYLSGIWEHSMLSGSHINGFRERSQVRALI